MKPKAFELLEQNLGSRDLSKTKRGLVGSTPMKQGFLQNAPMGLLPVIPKVSKTQFHKVSKLGGGTYGRVYQATSGESEQPVAVKRNFISLSLKDTVGSIRELDTLNLVKNHPYCIHLKDVLFEAPFSDGSMSPPEKDWVSDKTFLILEKGEMDGEKYLRLQPSPLITDRKKFILHLFLAIEFMHSRGVYHRDIKPANIICFMKNGRLNRAKVTDFGLSHPYSPQSMSMPGFVTLWYRAPEISLTKDYDYKVDVWSAGCILFETFSADNRRFMQPATDEALINAVMEKIPFSKEDYHLANQLYPKKISDSYAIVQQTQRTIDKHLGMSESQIAQFNSTQLGGESNVGSYSELISLLEKMLDSNPEQRWTISQCLNHSFFRGFRTLINQTRAAFSITETGIWTLKPNYAFKYISCSARTKAMEWFKIIYSNRLNPPVSNWYSHRILFHAIEMMDRYLILSGITDCQDGDVVVWINVFLFIAAKYFRIMLTEYGLNYFAAGIIPEQFNLFRQKAQSFEEHVIRDLFKGVTYQPSLFESADGFLSETGVNYLLKILLNEMVPSGTTYEKILSIEQETLLKANRSLIPLSSGQTPVVSFA